MSATHDRERPRQQVALAAPARSPALRPAAPEPLPDEFADLSELQDRLGTGPPRAGRHQPGSRRAWSTAGPRMRAEMEHRFGPDLDGVPVHTGDVAVESTQAMQALAYAVGRGIVLGAGQDPRSPSGRRVIMHELAHAVEHDIPPAPPTGPLSWAAWTTLPSAGPTGWQTHRGRAADPGVDAVGIAASEGEASQRGHGRYSPPSAAAPAARWWRWHMARPLRVGRSVLNLLESVVVRM